MSEGTHLPAGVDPTVASVGRMYDLFLGGTEYLEVDEKAADQIKNIVPEVIDAVWANRGFLQRATSWLARDTDVRQFIDIGAGLPTRNNTHEAAQDVAPESRVVYVDSDPIVAEHARVLLEGEENVAFIQADLRDPHAVLDHPDTRALLDFDQPIALTMVALIHFVSAASDPKALIKHYLDALPSGSYLVLSHATQDKQSPEITTKITKVYENSSEPFHFRTPEEILDLFEGLELVPPYAGAEPDLTFAGYWGAEDIEQADSDGSRWLLCGVARKP